MGVPKFFRYISERYPCLSELVRENQVNKRNFYRSDDEIKFCCSFASKPLNFIIFGQFNVPTIHFKDFTTSANDFF